MWETYLSWLLIASIAGAVYGWIDWLIFKKG